jgi:hypothetical protein
MSSPSGNQIAWQGAPSGDVAGYWYTYIGGGNSTGDNGSISNPGGTPSTDGGPISFQFTPIGGDAGVPAIADAGAFAHAACVEGTTPVKQYAFAAEGFYFAGVPAAGGSDAGNTKTFVDISSHTGISFWMYNGGSGPLSLSFQISDQESQPDGGICGLDGSPDNACNSPLLATGSPNGVTAMPGWNYFTEDFATLLVNTYYGYGDMSTMGAMGRSLDTAKAYDVQWQVNEEGADASAGVAFNFCIANVSFY